MNKKQCILLRTSGSIVQKNINSELNINEINIGQIKNLFKKTGTNNFERHCDYDMGEYVISILGWKTGKSGSENKTELPPPEDSDLYFGDILVLKSISSNNSYNDRTIVHLSKDEYEQFIEKAFGGFESLGESDTESDTKNDEYDSDDSFIVNSDEIDEIDEESIGEEEEFKTEDETSEDDNMSLHSDSDSESIENGSSNSDKSTESKSNESSNSEKSSDSIKISMPNNNLSETDSEKN